MVCLGIIILNLVLPLFHIQPIALRDYRLLKMTFLRPLVFIEDASKHVFYCTFDQLRLIILIQLIADYKLTTCCLMQACRSDISAFMESK